MNFASTADIIGGNSGSPVLDADLEVVGVVFDGNIESLPGDYIYLPESNRSVTVDVRAILEALDDVYDIDRLVLELTTGRLVATEAEADAARRLAERLDRDMRLAEPVEIGQHLRVGRGVMRGADEPAVHAAPPANRLAADEVAERRRAPVRDESEQQAHGHVGH